MDVIIKEIAESSLADAIRGLITRQQALYGIYAMAFIIACMFAIEIYRLGKNDVVKNQIDKVKIKSTKRLLIKMNERKKGKSQYEELEKKLRKSGFTFYFRNMNPAKYKTYQTVLSVVGALIGFILVGVAGGFLGFLLGRYAMEFVLERIDKRDNRELLNDINVMLGAVRLHNGVGSHILTSISGCYTLVRNKRLKRALIELSGDLRAKKSMDEALDNLQNKFNNVYINNFCGVVKQLMQTGYANNMLNNISKQMVELQDAQMNATNEKIDWEKNLNKIMVFVSVVWVLLIQMSLSIKDVQLF